MTSGIVLLLLRLLGAAVLLGFLLLIAWLIWQDLRVTRAALMDRERSQGTLEVIAGETVPVGVRFPLLPVTSIGRAGANTIVLADSYVSGEHALLTRRGDLWWLEDLGSRNGTLLNGGLLPKAAVVSHGDVITIGDVQMKIDLQQPSA